MECMYMPPAPANSHATTDVGIHTNTQQSSKHNATATTNTSRKQGNNKQRTKARQGNSKKPRNKRKTTRTHKKMGRAVEIKKRYGNA